MSRANERRAKKAFKVLTDKQKEDIVDLILEKSDEIAKFKHLGAERLNTIKCAKCGLVQDKAKDWDYQICKCGHYLYDHRGGL